MVAGDELCQADALHQEGDYAAAAELYHRALTGDPSLVGAWFGLGCAYISLQRYGAAVDALRRAVALRPDVDEARCKLAEALFQLGEVDAAVTEFHRVAGCGDPALRAIAANNLACITPGASGSDHAAVLAARQAWLGLAEPGKAAAPEHKPEALRTAVSGGKLKVGYLSGFFGARNWMKFVWGVVNRHDRDRFEIHLLSDGGDPSSASGYADHADDRVWQIEGLPNEQLSRHIAEAGLDVLVDLNGYSYQPRMKLFTRRSAPLQLSWMGMYGTTGAPETDYVVGDASVVRAEEEPFFSERVARVPGSYLAFTVSYPVPEVGPPPCLATGAVTFGCLSSAYKITPESVASYARILRAVPRSQLLFRNQTLGDESNREWLAERFAQHGVSRERLVLESGAEHYEFLQTYDRIDIALDTFPYNGGTTTAEALWQGVPMLSFDGDRWASRTSRSLLLAAGLSEFVASDQPGFEAMAIALATSPDCGDRLAALRAEMRPRLKASAACDVAGLRRALEALYLTGTASPN